jgi:hypothetical protein
VCSGSCGDGVCNATESCSSCPSDCSCSTTNLCGFDANQKFDFLGDILQLESADQTTCLWIARTLSGGCTSASCVQAKFTITDARVGHSGKLVTLGTGSTLTWNDSRHNNADTAELDNNDTQFSLSIAGMNHPAVFDPSVPTTLDASAISSAGAAWCSTPLVPYAP